ncbi:hypothetical protein MMC17_007688 [Xylographa soralifera]|nr:hypothetical protein [Xylographa soralifera]
MFCARALIMLPNQALSLSLAAVIAMMSLLQVLGASMLLRESVGADNSPLSASRNFERSLTEDVSDWQAQLVKRMENTNPNAPQALNPNVANQQGPFPHPHQPNALLDEDQGVPGVNLPCGWLDGQENPDGEEGVDSMVFHLDTGRYILHIRWTRTPHLAGVQAHVNLIDVNVNDINDFNADEPWDTMFFPGTRMPFTVIVDRPQGRDFFMDLVRYRLETDPPGDLANDAAAIWWFEQAAEADAGAAASGSRGRRRPMRPVDEGVEPPSQKIRSNP